MLVGSDEPPNNSSHHITVTNIRNNETVHHSFLLLKGIVRHENCSGAKRSGDCDLKVSIGSRDFRATKSRGHFNCLVQLKPDDNHVTLTYCCLGTDLNVRYVRRKSRFQVVPVYIINDGHDGSFQAPETEANSVESACDRILTGCKLLQCFVAEKLNEDGFGRKTFQLESDDRCSVFRSELGSEDARKMRQDELWTGLGREIMTSEIGCVTKKFLGFVSCTKYNGEAYSDEFGHDQIVSLTDAYVALGGGGLALFGSACLYTWPRNVYEVVSRFEDQTKVDRTKFMDDSCYRGTLGACFSTTLGSVLHELCHTFDLGHTEAGVMGRGFDNIHKFFLDCDFPLSTNEVQGDPGAKPKGSAVTIKVGKASANVIIRNASMFRGKIAEGVNGKDETFFTSHCSALLSYHKYFNDHADEGRSFVLSFDKTNGIVRSTAGIRVVEIREDGHETVLEHWTFVGRVLKYSFEVPGAYFGDGFVLVVEDNVGTILKEFCAK